MLSPKIFMLLTGISLLLVTGVFLLSGTSAFQDSKKQAGQKMHDFASAKKNITVLFIDITESDSGKAWTSQPFRQQFVRAVNTCITNSHDVFAAYLIHGNTRDAQPFWTNYPLSSLEFQQMDDSACMIYGDIEKQDCIEAFDSIASQTFLQRNSRVDSMLTEFTDVFGALQQAALYFRRFTTNARDVKRLFLLSDGKENAGFAAGSIKLNNIGTVDSARSFAGAALTQIRNTTDIKNELRYSEIYFHTPNDRLYYNDERNLRRIFWETLLEDKLQCNKVHYF
jgi:hypothetical protein